MTRITFIALILLFAACGAPSEDSGLVLCEHVTCFTNAEFATTCGLDCADPCEGVTCGDEDAGHCGLECPCDSIECGDPLAESCDLACPDPCEGVVCGDINAAECGLSCPTVLTDVECRAASVCEAPRPDACGAGFRERWGNGTPYCRATSCDVVTCGGPDEHCEPYPPSSGHYGDVHCACDEGYKWDYDEGKCMPWCDPTEVVGEVWAGYRIHSASFGAWDDPDFAPALGYQARVQPAVFQGAGWSYSELVYTDANGVAVWPGGHFVPADGLLDAKVLGVHTNPNGTQVGHTNEYDIENDEVGGCVRTGGTTCSIVLLSVDVELEYEPVYKTCD